LSAGASPQTPLGELTALRRPLPGLGGGTPGEREGGGKGGKGGEGKGGEGVLECPNPELASLITWESTIPCGRESGWWRPTPWACTRRRLSTSSPSWTAWTRSAASWCGAAFSAAVRRALAATTSDSQHAAAALAELRRPVIWPSASPGRPRRRRSSPWPETTSGPPSDSPDRAGRETWARVAGESTAPKTAGRVSTAGCDAWTTTVDDATTCRRVRFYMQPRTETSSTSSGVIWDRLYRDVRQSISVT